MKKKLVISIFDDLHNPSYGGGGARVVHELAKRLLDSYEIIVLTGRYPGSEDRVEDGVSYRHIGTERFGSKINQFFFHFYLMYYATKLDFDIWIESFTPPFSTSCLQLFTRKPVLALVQMLSGEDMMRKYHIPFHWIENMGLGTYKYFCIVSPFLEEKIRKHNKTAHIELIASGIDLSKNITANSSNEKYILYVGRIEINQKGLDLLVDAFSQIADTSAYKLYIVGGGNKEDEDTLQKLIQKSGAQDRIIVKGRIVGDAKEDLYRNATLVVVPSRFETFGLVVLEALSFGKPVVYFNLDSLNWIPAGVGKSVEQFSTKEYGKAIRDLLLNESVRKELALSAIDYSKRYDWGIVVGKYRDYLDRIYSSHSADK